MFRKILIANRGEIACRIIRTARAMGIGTVAVYSDADAQALHTGMADEAHAIGPAPARDSYLCGAKLIEAALASGAQAVHPGYGFLSENAGFAQACAAAGLVFIGPPAEAIRAMGDKAHAKALMQQAGVPLVPGYLGDESSEQALLAAARKIGFPVLIKAVAGGGGKGMRAVEDEKSFTAHLASAQREAVAAFGDGRVLLEKYLARARHVEVQIFADAHGQCIHLFDRDCSIQRRHQKVIEEAPAPGLGTGLRSRMAAAAIAAARAIGYRGAGTVEFLLDGDEFYFMEMNTRLQVEHAVTEAITGLDLVEWQLRVAAGEPLPAKQNAIRMRGHAIESRLYAEDPASGFLPSPGRLEHLHLPAAAANLRIDSGVRQGDSIGVHYDPLIAKLIAWGEDRDEAARRLQLALAEVEVAGVATNAGYLAATVAHPAFLSADLDTGFLARHRETLLAPLKPPSDTVLSLAALGVLLERRAAAEREAAASADPYSPWARCNGWRLNGETREELHMRHASVSAIVTVAYRGDTYNFWLPGGEVQASGALGAGGRLSAVIGGARHSAGFVRSGAELSLFFGSRRYVFALADSASDAVDATPAGGLTAPFPGTITAVFVETGARVSKGQPVAAMEAMKMEHVLGAPSDGVVLRLHYAPGDLVDYGAAIVEFQAADGGR